MEYPLFIPPAPLFEKSHFDWTLKEARAYLEWFLGQVEPRTAALLQYLDERDDSDRAALLDRVGKKVAAVVMREPFNAPAGGRPHLTNSGYALGADAGLLLARSLLQSSPAVRWEILRKPKREMSFHLPVLVGMGPIHLDPIAGSIAEFHGILRGERGADFLARAYSFWRTRAEGRSTT
jgi:hypothetical protein